MKNVCHLHWVCIWGAKWPWHKQNGSFPCLQSVCTSSLCSICLLMLAQLWCHQTHSLSLLLSLSYPPSVLAGHTEVRVYSPSFHPLSKSFILSPQKKIIYREWIVPLQLNLWTPTVVMATTGNFVFEQGGEKGRGKTMQRKNICIVVLVFMVLPNQKSKLQGLLGERGKCLFCNCRLH